MQLESEVEIEHMSFCVSKVRFGRLSLVSRLAETRRELPVKNVVRRLWEVV